MKFEAILQILQQRLAGADILLVFLIGFAALVIMFILTAKYGTGFFLALTFVFTGLLLVNSNVIAGLALIARFPLVLILALYALIGRKNKVNFSRATAFFLLLPAVMFVNSFRAYSFLDALGQSFLFFLFYIGLILGGQRILGDERGRSIFIKTIAIFTIIISCVQVPYLATAQGRLAGTFQTPVGYMIIGTTGVIVLFWLALQQKVGSLSFIIYTIFSTLSFLLLLLTGGRTAMGGTFLGILVLLSRRLKRNLVILLACLIILGPFVLELVLSFPGFENVKDKLFSTKDTRSHLWSYAWNEIQAKPWVGWGTGIAAIKSQQQLQMTYHQTYLEFAVDHGIPFAIFMMLVFVWLPFRGLFLMRRCQTEEMKSTANLSAAILMSYAFASFFAGVLNATTFILPIYSLIALQEGVRAENREIEYGYELDYTEDGLLDGTVQQEWQQEFAGREQL